MLGFVLPQLVGASQPAPTLSVNDVTLSEDSCQNTTFLFTVTLSKLPSKGVTVDYATSNGSALAGEDYVATSGSLTFTHKTATKGPQGSYLLTVSVPLGNHVVSGASKGFTLTLSGATNATISDAEGVGTLLAPAAGCAPSTNAGCSVNFCGATTTCQQVNRSADATPYCSLAGLGTTPAPDPSFAGCSSAGAWADSDGDGLSDAAETQGYLDVNADGVYDAAVDVSLPDADPHVPDVYLHYDYLVAADHDHKPPPQSIQYVAEAFAAHGARLHIDPQHTAIDESTAKVVTLTNPPDPACTGPSAKSMAQLRAETNFGNRALAYHYVVFGHYSSTDSAGHALACTQDPECGGGSPPPFGALGSGEINGNDAIVSLGFYTDNGVPIPDETWAGLLMHELGHNLGLKHGGPDCDNYKPNYLSVMNYDFYTTGIPVGAAPGDSAAKACVTDADCGPAPVCPGPECEAPAHCSATTHKCYRLDYSSFKYNDLPEAGLNDTIGLTGRPNSKDVTLWTPDQFTSEYCGPTNGAPIDWNQDAVFENPSPGVDINGDSSQTLLAGSNDWATSSGLFTHLNFDFQCTTTFADSP